MNVNSGTSPTMYQWRIDVANVVLYKTILMMWYNIIHKWLEWWRPTYCYLCRSNRADRYSYTTNVMQVAGTTLQEREEGQYDYTGFSMFPLKRKKTQKRVMKVPLHRLSPKVHLWLLLWTARHAVEFLALHGFQLLLVCDVLLCNA